jgi:hypothetical protein
MDVIVHDRNFNIRYKVTLFECYPKSIQDIGLDYGDAAPMKLRVAIQYKYYVIEDTVIEKEKIQAIINNSVNSDVASSSKTSHFIGLNNVAPDPTPPVTANYKYIPYTG